MTEQQLEPGWYPDGHGADRWWTGTAWTEHTRPPVPPPPSTAPAAAAEPAAAEDGGLLTFASHIAGKNASVTIYPDRLEWTRSGLMTLGRSSHEVVPIRSITSVSSKRSGIARTVVQIVTAGGTTLDLHVGNRDVDRVKSLLRDLTTRT